MLRTLKTTLTKTDLIKPALDVGAAASGVAGDNSAAGALVLPLQQDVSQALAASSTPVSDDWKKRGNPAAPAIKEMEAIALMEKQQAEAAAAAMPLPAAPELLGGGPAGLTADTAPLIQDVAPTPTRRPDQQPYAWMPKPTLTYDTSVDDIPDIWSKPTVIDNLPPGAAARPAAPIQPVEGELPAAAEPVIPASTSQPQAMPDEGVIYIPHDPAKTIVPSITIPTAPKAPADGEFAAGAAVTIPHDSPKISAVPYMAGPASSPTHKTPLGP